MVYIQFTEGGIRPLPLVSSRKQLLPNIIDGFALIKPEASWAKIPRNPVTWLDGTRTITHRDFANAINVLATWLIDNLGPPRRPFQPVAYFGDWDPRYHVFTLAAVKAGYKAVLPSGARGKDDLLDFLQELDCDDVLFANRDSALATELAGEKRVTLYDMPSLSYLLDTTKAHMPYTKTFAEAKTDPILVLHTSGTTGQPKPLIYTHDWVSTWFVQFHEPPPVGYQSLETLTQGVNMLGFTPQAHVRILKCTSPMVETDSFQPAGFFTNLLLSILKEMTCLYPLPSATFSVECFLETLTNNPGTDVTLCPPVILDKLAGDEALLEVLVNSVRMVTFAGGPLSQRAGRILSTRTRLWTMYAMGENCGPHKLHPEGPYIPGRWNQFMLHPNTGIDMRLLPGTEDSYECVVVRPDQPGEEQPVFKMHPHLQEWSTGDVFIKHGRPDGTAGLPFYEYAHRLADTVQLIVDDPLRLIAVRTLTPLKFEQELSVNDPINAVVVFGDRKRCPGLLVELSSTHSPATVEVREIVRGRVHGCTQLLGMEIAGERIIFTQGDKGLPRSAKGGVRRSAALQLYRDEIEEVYQQTT